MKRRFSFDKIRNSVVDKSTVVIQGYSNEAFTKVNETKVILEAGREIRVYKAEVVTSKLLPVFAVVRNGFPLSYMTNIYLKLSDGDRQFIERSKGQMTIYYNDEEGIEESLFKCRLGYVEKSLGNIIYAIDDIEKQDGMVTISGWAIDSEEVRIGLYSVAGKHAKRIESEVEWSVRDDAAQMIAECPESRLSGFRISAKTDATSLRLLIQTRSRKKIIKINPIENSKKSRITGRVSQTKQILEYNINTIGFAGTSRKIINKVFRGKLNAEINYDKWRIDREPGEVELTRQKQIEQAFKVRPKFSIVVPMYNSNEKLLEQLIQSILNQTYSNWELCLSDGSADRSRLKSLINKYIQRDDRIRYISVPQDKRGETLGIAANTNAAMDAASGDYIVFGDHDDLFAPNALFECVRFINERQNSEDSENKMVHAIYTDEDKVDEAGKCFSMPNFKPDFNLDLLRSVNYICHMFVVSRELCAAVGKLSSEYDGAQDYDYILRCVDKLYEWKTEMYHIPKALYHWRIIDSSTSGNPKAKLYAFENGKKAIEAHLNRRGLVATVEMGEDLGYYDVHYRFEQKINMKAEAYEPRKPVLSIIIPNKDHISDLKKCIESIDNYSSFRDYEFIIVENNSTEQETFEYYKDIDSRDNVKVITWDGIFNYSAINNFGAGFASGDYLLLLNNDTEIINEDAIEDMLGFCQRDDVGAVGARLYYEDDTLQHAGVVVGIGGIAGHSFQRQPELPGEIYFNRSKMTSDYSAVTAACLMVRRDVFEKVGGLDEKFEVAFNDIDFCLKIREEGYLVVYDAWARFHHYESKSRGYEDSIEKKERFRREISRLQQKWTKILTDGDPYYNPNLTLERQDFGLRI